MNESEVQEPKDRRSNLEHGLQLFKQKRREKIAPCVQILRDVGIDWMDLWLNDYDLKDEEDLNIHVSFYIHKDRLGLLENLLKIKDKTKIIFEDHFTIYYWRRHGFEIEGIQPSDSIAFKLTDENIAPHVDSLGFLVQIEKFMKEQDFHEKANAAEWKKLFFYNPFENYTNEHIGVSKDGSFILE